MRLFIPALIIAGLASASLAAPPVEVTRLPAHAMQPRTALSQGGAVHLVYLTGDPHHSDVQYRRQSPDAKDFAPPVRVNSERGSAIAAGTVRGAELAIDAAGRVHIVWNGADQVSLRVGGQLVKTAPVLYAHSDDGQKFTDQQNIMHASWSLDGGCSIAATAKDRIAIIWHADDASKPQSEENRGIFIATSTDRGQTFTPETRIPDATDGACACCGLHAFADSTGHLGILYRRAYKAEERDQTLLLETDKGWQRTRLDPWPLKACPMTTSDAFALKDGVLLAWETKGQVWLGKWNGDLIKTMTAAPGKPDNRKHPRVTALPTGEVLLLWTEGTAWDKGGSIAWQQFDADLKPLDNSAGRAEGLPAWGTAAAWPTKDGFRLIY